MANAPVNSIHYADKLGLSKVLNGLGSILPPPQVNITYFCIGSDLSTGDCFGPLTGTLLKNLGFQNVIGTLDSTVHAKNLEEKLSLVPEGNHILAVDATMGHYQDIGRMHFINGPIHPGSAFKRDLPPVGQSSVIFNVAPLGFANFLTLGCASMNKVWLGANLLTRAICLLTYRRKKALLEYREQLEQNRPSGDRNPEFRSQNSG